MPILKKGNLGTILYIVISFPVIFCANILIMSPCQSVSHSIIMETLAKSLVRRGHEIDMVSYYPLKEPLQGYTDISIQATSKLLTDALTVEQVKKLGGITLLASMVRLCGTGACQAAFQEPRIQQLRNSTKKYDLLITEHFTAECTLGFAWSFGVPSILVESSIILPWTADMFGLPDNPSYIPTYFVEFTSEMSFFQRIINTWNLVQAKILYTDINIQETSTLFPDAFTVEHAKKLKGIAMLDSMIRLCGTGACKSAFKEPRIQQLRNSSKKYDLLITEHFTADCMLGFAWLFGVPSVLVETSIILPWTADMFGLPDNPSYIPTYFVEYTSEMSFFQRIINTWNLVRAKILYEYMSTRPNEQLAREFFGPKMPSFQDLAYNSSLLLANTHYSINDARPLVPNVIEVAGLHIDDPKPLNEYYNEILSTDLQGIIYFTMGSIVAAETFPAKTLQDMFDAMSELPFKVLFRARKENFPNGLNIPGNIHFEAWMPQLDILCDPRVKLFVSHGGMMSTQEAVYCGVPILGIPLFADQKYNTKHAEQLGYALTMKDITKDTFLAAATKLLFDPKYAQNAKKISEDFKDRPMTPKDTAIYWIEYVIKHKGAPKLQSAARHVPWFQYYLIDIIAVMIGVPCLLIYLLYRLVKSVFFRKNVSKFKLN